MKTVILAGGLGTRIAEYTEQIPKPMIEIGGLPIIWHIMKIYSSHGFNEFIICLGYKGYIIKEYFSNYFRHLSDITIDLRDNSIEVHQTLVDPWKITLIDTGESSMTGGRIKAVKDYIGDETFFLTYGDGVGNIDITKSLEFHKEHGRMATVTGVNPPGRFGVLDIHDEMVKGFAEKVDNQNSLINGGYFVCEPGVIDLIEGPNTVWEEKPLEKLAKTGNLMNFHHKGFWQPMDTLRDKKYLENLWQTGQAPWKIWK